jgi:hypothetical protein
MKCSFFIVGSIELKNFFFSLFGFLRDEFIQFPLISKENLINSSLENPKREKRNFFCKKKGCFIWGLHFGNT